MPIVVPDAGAIQLLAQTLGSLLPVDGTCECRLFTNNYTPVAGTVTANFTEASFAGYAAKTVNRSEWTVPVIDAGRAKSLYGLAPFVWTNTGSTVTVYGAFIVGLTTGVTLWCERFAVAQVVSTGAMLRYRMVMKGKSE